MPAQQDTRMAVPECYIEFDHSAIDPEKNRRTWVSIGEAIRHIEWQAKYDIVRVSPDWKTGWIWYKVNLQLDSDRTPEQVTEFWKKVIDRRNILPYIGPVCDPSVRRWKICKAMP